MTRENPELGDLFSPFTRIPPEEELLTIMPAGTPEGVQLVCRLKEGRQPRLRSLRELVWRNKEGRQLRLRSLRGKVTPLCECREVASVALRASPAGGGAEARPGTQLVVCLEKGGPRIVDADGGAYELGVDPRTRRILPLEGWKDRVGPHFLCEVPGEGLWVYRDDGLRYERWAASIVDRAVLPGAPDAQALCAADLDGDGREELVLATDEASLLVLRSDGTKAWALHFDGTSGLGGVLARRLDCSSRLGLVVGAPDGFVSTYDCHGVRRSRTHLFYRVQHLTVIEDGAEDARIVAAVAGGVLQFMDRHGAWTWAVDLGPGREVVALGCGGPADGGGPGRVVVALGSGLVGLLRTDLPSADGPAVPGHEMMEPVLPIPYRSYPLLMAQQQSRDLEWLDRFVEGKPSRRAMLLLGARSTGKDVLVEVLKARRWPKSVLVESVHVDSARAKTCDALLGTALDRLQSRVPTLEVPEAEGERAQQRLHKFVKAVLHQTAYRRVVLVVVHAHILGEEFKPRETSSFIEALRTTVLRHPACRILFVSPFRLDALDVQLGTSLERWVDERPLSRLGEAAFNRFLKALTDGFYELHPDGARAIGEMTGRNPRFSATILWQLHKSQRQKADEEGVKAVKDATAGALAHYLEGMLRELDEQEAVLLAAAGDYARAGHEAFSVESLATHCPVLALLRGSEVLSGLLDRLVKRWLLEGMGEGRYSFASTLLATLASNLPALDELLRADLRRTCRAFPLRALPDVLEHLGIRATEGQSQATDGARDLRRLSQVAGHWRVLCRATDRRSPVAGRPGPSLLSAIRELLGTERTAWHAKDDLLLEEHDLSAVGRAMPDRVCFFVRLGDQPERSEFDGLTKRIEGAAADVGVVAADGSKLPQTVVFLLTADQGGSYRAYLSQQPGNHIVVLSGDELKELFLGADPTDYLIKRLVSGQIGIQGLIPYETQAPVSARMFFGRRDVLNRILGNVGRGYAIYGPRRIGKTSLLRRVADRLKETKAAHPVFIDCAALGKGDLGWVILNRIGLRGRQYYQSQGLEESLRHLGELRGKPVVLLLDEVDSLLARDRGQGWHILYALRQAMNDEHCAVVVAGYRELFKERSDLNSPLFNFLEPVPLDKLAEDAARGLILEPMRDMRLEFEDSEAFIERVLHLSGSLPSLIQLFCRGVTERLFAGKRYFATAADVDEVLAEDDVRRSLLTTFQGNTTKLEQLLCNLVVGRLPVDEVGVHEILNEHLDVGFDEVSQACANLWMANIISRDPDDELSFASGAMEKVVLRSAKRQIGVLLKELRRTRGN